MDLAVDLPYTPPAKDMVAIYCLRDPRFSGAVEAVRYIGRTMHPGARLARHKGASDRGTYRNRWIRKLGDLGLTPTLHILAWVSGQEWQQAERAYIAYANAQGCRLTNGTDGGDGIPGTKLAPHVKAAQSAWQRSEAHLAALRAGRIAQLVAWRSEHLMPVPCACGCGTLIPPRARNGAVRRYVKGHQRRSLSRTPGPCACGCGTMIAPYNKKGKACHYVYGHQGRRPCTLEKRAAISSSLQGHTTPDETRSKISATLRGRRA